MSQISDIPKFQDEIARTGGENDRTIQTINYVCTLQTLHYHSLSKNASLSVSSKGRTWHSVAVDEAHEMFVHPTQDYIHRVANYIPYRKYSQKRRKFTHGNFTVHNITDNNMNVETIAGSC